MPGNIQSKQFCHPYSVTCSLPSLSSTLLSRYDVGYIQKILAEAAQKPISPIPQTGRKVKEFTGVIGLTSIGAALTKTTTPISSYTFLSSCLETEENSSVCLLSLPIFFQIFSIHDAMRQRFSCGI